MFSRFLRLVRLNRFQQRSLGYVVHGIRKEYVKSNNFNPTYAPVPFYFAALWGMTRKKDDDKSFTAKEVVIAKADALFEQEDYREIYKLLNSIKDSADVEILWRLSRALYKMSKLETKEAEAKRMVYEAYDLITEALSLADDHWAVHKWVAILLNTKTSYEGTKVKIRELHNIKNHMLRATELNPKDATTLYMLGNWCYQVADLAWYQRKIASAIFGEPPTSSFEEALHFFEQAEKVDPNFYSHNLLMLGKTYLKLNKKNEAIKYLKMTSEYQAKNDDDQEAKQEATTILNHI